MKIKSEIETPTNFKISKSITLLIEYYFKDNLCSYSRNNNWTKFKISGRKQFTNPNT